MLQSAQSVRSPDSFYFVHSVRPQIRCLGRSRLTAIPCFVFVISSLKTKALQPQLAPAEPAILRFASIPSYNKKGHNKSYSLFYLSTAGLVLTCSR